MKKTASLLAILLLFWATPSLAVNDGSVAFRVCWEVSQDHASSMDCLHRIFQDYQKQMNKKYEKRLKEAQQFDVNDKPFYKHLENISLEKVTIKNQKDFLQYMESECNHRIVITFTGANGAGDARLACKINLISERLERL